MLGMLDKLGIWGWLLAIVLYVICNVATFWSVFARDLRNFIKFQIVHFMLFAFAIVGFKSCVDCLASSAVLVVVLMSLSLTAFIKFLAW